VASVLALAGGAFTAAGIRAFRRARTTLDPTTPERTSSLVTGGIYGATRNPMYVGVLFLLLAWAAFLCAPWALVGPVLFVAYMNRFQIGPEEKVLMAAFGGEYARYKSAVRRWL
jgi:protein-S-isoprenylcysteine O-methyltransferase Ste14